MARWTNIGGRAHMSIERIGEGPNKGLFGLYNSSSNQWVGYFKTKSQAVRYSTDVTMEQYRRAKRMGARDTRFTSKMESRPAMRKSKRKRSTKRKPSAMKGMGKAIRLSSAKALKSVTGKAGKTFAFRTKNGNVAMVKYGQKNKAKVFKKAVTVQYKAKDGNTYRLTDMSIRKRVKVKRKRRSK